MYSIQKLSDTAKHLGIPSEGERLCTVFPFDLSCTCSTDRCDGIVVSTDKKISVIINGEITRNIDCCDIKSFSVVPGIGCRTIEYTTTDGKDHILCRGSELYAKVFTAAVGDLTLISRGDTSVSVREYPMGNACPVCGRPYSPGSEICAKCAGKSSYVARLMKIAAPWKWMIVISVLLYFVTSVVSLIPPRLNKILVDDFIKAENAALFAFIGVIVSIFAVNILNLIISAIRSLVMIETGAGFIAKLRQITFDKIQALSISRINARTSGELINRVSSDCDTVKNFIVNEVGEDTDGRNPCYDKRDSLCI